MCGIAGIHGRRDRQAVEAMIAAMRHRGPDGWGCVDEGETTLGMTRLAVLDRSEAGRQPMATPDGRVWIVYNGECYNFAEHRRELESTGVELRSHCDTEVVLRLYEKHGDDFVKRLRGMFALAIYDRRGGPGRERLLLARDQMGIKPLLYAWSGGALVFASELKAMLAGRLVPAAVDPEGVRQLLTFGAVVQPGTMIAGVRALPPGHRMIVEGGRARVEAYWSPGTGREPGLAGMAYEGQVEFMRGVLDEAVRLQMVSDVPLGAFLSGGVDSTLLVAMMARHARGRLKTFSVGFEAEGGAIDETRDAQRNAAFIGVDHERVVVTGRDVREAIEDIGRALDQPSVDGVNSYFVSRAARREMTVAISGTGGDELFGGYPWFATMARWQEQGATRAWRRAGARAMGRVAGAVCRGAWYETAAAERLDAMRGMTGFLGFYALQHRIFGPVEAGRMLNKDLRRAGHAGRDAAGDLAGADLLPGADAFNRVSALCLRGYTLNQLLRDIDAVSMAHSLEVRVPFLDVPVADAAMSLPWGSKMSAGGTGDAIHGTYRELGVKRMLLDVGKGLLPGDMDRQPKRGFGMPFDHWLRGPLREVLMEATGPAAARRGLVDPEAARATAEEFLAGRQGWGRAWVLMMLEVWCREVVDKAGV